MNLTEIIYFFGSPNESKRIATYLGDSKFGFKNVEPPYQNIESCPHAILFIIEYNKREDILKILRKFQGIQFLPIVFLLDKPDELSFRTSFRLGAKDIIYSSMEPYEITSRIKSAIKRNRHLDTINMELNETTSSLDQLENAMLQYETMSLEISFLNDNLESEIAERKRIEASLRESETQLKAANATKDRFFSIIAHDLKNPFNALIGLTNVLLTQFDTFDDTNKVEFIKHIKDASENTFILLSELLEWSRSQMGQLQMNIGDFQVYELIHEAIRPLKTQASNKKIALTANVDSNLHAQVDRQTIITVVRNLASNAIKFTGSGGKVEVYTTSDENEITVSIKDTGVGMAEKNLEKLFKIDEQFKTKGTANETGTGLGLILCKEFVEKNKGIIWAESELGVGSEFKFTIPISGI